jgi:hypothetical protein
MRVEIAHMTSFSRVDVVIDGDELAYMNWRRNDQIPIITLA